MSLIERFAARAERERSPGQPGGDGSSPAPGAPAPGAAAPEAPATADDTAPGPGSAVRVEAAAQGETPTPDNAPEPVPAHVPPPPPSPSAGDMDPGPRHWLASDDDHAPAARDVVVAVEDVAKVFDVSPPWLNRVIERKPRLLLHAVDGVSFDIARGETLALVGESGCGKSTVARLLVGLYAPTRGRVAFEGHDVSELGTSRGRPLRSRLQMIFQDPYASLNPRWKVADIIAEPIRVHRLIRGRAAIRARIEELLGQVGLAAADAEKFPHQFSGGQRQRLSIARALASQPDFLVCDEPTSALDVSVQAQVLNLMRDIQRANRLTYLFISHNLAVVHHVSDRVGVMYLGRVVELADKATLFARPRHPYTRMLLDAIPDVQMTGKARTPVAGEVPNPLDPPAGCSFHPRCPHANDRCRIERPATTTLPDGTRVACHGVDEGRI